MDSLSGHHTITVVPEEKCIMCLLCYATQYALCLVCVAYSCSGSSVASENRKENMAEISLICEENLLDTIFHACDTQRRGTPTLTRSLMVGSRSSVLQQAECSSLMMNYKLSLCIVCVFFRVKGRSTSNSRTVSALSLVPPGIGNRNLFHLYLAYHIFSSVHGLFSTFSMLFWSEPCCAAEV